MAEVVGIIASSAALVQLIEYGFKFSKFLYRFIGDSNTIFGDLHNFATQIQGSMCVIEIARSTVEKYIVRKCNADIREHLQRYKVLENIYRKCDEIRDGLGQVWDDIRFFDHTLWRKALSTWRWSRYKSLMKTLRSGILDVKSDMQMLMNTLSLHTQEAKIAKTSDVRSRAKLEEKIKTLKFRIRNQLEVIEQLQLSLTRARTKQSPAMSATATTSDALVDLGRSICRDGTIPGQVKKPAREPITPVPVPPQPPTRSIVVAAESRSSSRPPTVRGSSSEQSWCSQCGKPSSLCSARAGSPATTILPPKVHPTSDQDVPHVESVPAVKSVLSVHSTSSLESEIRHQEPFKILHLDATGRTLHGYIMKPDKILQVTVMTNTHLEGNIISRARAEFLGLTVKPLISDHWASLPSVHGEIQQSIGSATLQWSEGELAQLQSPPLEVTCEVFEACPLDFVLGRPFLEERETRWDRRRRRSNGRSESRSRVSS